MLEQSINALYEIADHVSRGDTIDETLANAVKLSTDLLLCDECCTYVRQGNELVPWVWKYVEKASPERDNIPIGAGLAAALSKRLTPLAISHDLPVPSFRRFEEWSTNPGETSICVPFLSRSRLMGAMTLHHRRPRVYTPRDLKFLCTIGYLVGADLGIAAIEQQNSDLILKLETRKLVERSKGILQRDLGMSEHEAYLALQKQSEQRNRTMKDIAQAIILNAEIRGSLLPAD